jgi:hypothetical protein
VKQYFELNDGPFPLEPLQIAMAGLNKKPFLVFVRPEYISFANLGKNLGNEALIFHEALHGFTGLKDKALMIKLGIPVGSGESQTSCLIDSKIRYFVLNNLQEGGLDQTFLPPCMPTEA